MDWVGVLTALATVVALWQLLGRQIKESEGRNCEQIKKSEERNREAHVGLKTLIKESEERSDKAHGELGTRIESGFNRLNDSLLQMANDMGYLRGRQDGDATHAAGSRRTDRRIDPAGGDEPVNPAGPPGDGR